ncbi:hypothetical protein ACP70R_023947 [Stipagrostis hirtigluma subsp. patula]
MASKSTSWALLLLLAVCLVAGADAVTVAMENMCNFTVWPAAISAEEDDGPYGFELGAGRTGTFNFPEPPRRTVIWGRTGCHYDSDGFTCETGNCGELACSSSIEQTLMMLPRLKGTIPTIAYLSRYGNDEGMGNSAAAEDDDYRYTIFASLPMIFHREFFNLPMEFICITATGKPISRVRCMEPDCPDGGRQIGDGLLCPKTSSLKLTFCPDPRA